MKKNITLLLAATTMLLAGCSSPFRTLESKDGKLSMTEEGHRGRAPTTWELKEVSSAAEIKTLRKSGWKPADGIVRNSVIHHDGGPDTFHLKRKVSLPTTAQAVAAPPPSHSMLITTFGIHPSPDGTWRIGVAEDSICFMRPAAGGGGISTTDQPDGWKAETGWFVFTESESRVWAYDGGNLIYLEAFWPSSAAMYCGVFRGTNFDSNFPWAVPPEVISRLPEQKQKEIQKHG